MAKTVYGSVPLTVNLTHVNTPTDGALAVQDGRMIIVQRVIISDNLEMSVAFSLLIV